MCVTQLYVTRTIDNELRNHSLLIWGWYPMPGPICGIKIKLKIPGFWYIRSDSVWWRPGKCCLSPRHEIISCYHVSLGYSILSQNVQCMQCILKKYASSALEAVSIIEFPLGFISIIEFPFGFISIIEFPFQKFICARQENAIWV